MSWRMLTTSSVAPIDGYLTWLVQSSVLLAVGLLAGRLLRRRGPAVQSTLYRTILVAVFLTPVASMAIAAMGFPGLVIWVPSAAADDKIEVADRGPARVGPIAWQGSSATPTSFDRRAIAPSAVEPPNVLSAGTTPEPVESVTGPDWIALMASIILAFWLLGTAILAMRLLVGHRRMARLRGTAIPAEPEAAGAVPRASRANATEAPSGPSFSLPVESMPGRPAPTGHPAAGGRGAAPA